VLDCPSLEGVWNCGDRVPDTFVASSSQNSTATLTNCTGSGNSALNAGGLANYGDMTTLTNCTVIKKNHASTSNDDIFG